MKTMCVLQESCTRNNSFTTTIIIIIIINLTITVHPFDLCTRDMGHVILTYTADSGTRSPPLPTPYTRLSRQTIDSSQPSATASRGSGRRKSVLYNNQPAAMPIKYGPRRIHGLSYS